MNIFPQHIPFRKLADYVEGDLPLTERVDLELHTASCPRCADELRELEHLITLMRTDVSRDAPSAVIHRAEDLFRLRAVPESAVSGLRRRVLARLHFDSVGLAPAFGVRSGKPGARQLLFSTGVDEIDLRIEPAGQTWTLSGQVLGESAAGGKAVLQGNAGNTEAPINELSEFVLPPVQAGTYKLIVKLPDLDVEIEEIKIGS
jgi:anti-sigma factor RsiW